MTRELVTAIAASLRRIGGCYVYVAAVFEAENRGTE